MAKRHRAKSRNNRKRLQTILSIGRLVSSFAGAAYYFLLLHQELDMLKGNDEVLGLISNFI